MTSSVRTVAREINRTLHLRRLLRMFRTPSSVTARIAPNLRRKILQTVNIPRLRARGAISAVQEALQPLRRPSPCVAISRSGRDICVSTNGEPIGGFADHSNTSRRDAADPASVSLRGADGEAKCITCAAASVVKPARLGEQIEHR